MLNQETEAEMKDRVLAEAMSNPGTLAVGSQTGTTPSGQGLAPVPTTFQALQQQNPVNVLTSNKANAYVMDAATAAQNAAGQRAQDAANAVNSQSGTLDNYTQQASGLKVTDASKQAYINQLPPADPNETSQERDLRNAVMQGGTAGLSAGNALSALTQLRKNRLLMDKAQQNLTEDQASQLATTKATEFKMGQNGTGYAQAALAKLADRQQQQMDEFNRKKQDALNAAWDAALGGNYRQAEQFKAEAVQVTKDAQEAQKMALENRKSMLEYNDLLEQHGNAVIDRMVASGYQPTDAVLEANDRQWDLPAGTSRISYEIAQKNAQVKKDAEALKKVQEQAKFEADTGKTTAETAKIFNDIKNSSFDLAKDLVDMQSKVPVGQMITIGDKQYSGWNTGNLKQGIEVDNSGMATGWTFDPATQQWNIQKLGNIGATKDGWELQQTNHGLFNYNKNTGQLIPISASLNQAGDWGSVIADGSQGGQCGRFVNLLGGFGFGDKWQDKQDKTDATIGTPENPLQVGDGVVMKIGGWTGHAAMVQSIAPDPKDPNNMLIQLMESNLHGDEKVTRRWISANDPTITGFAHPTKLAAQLQTGSGATKDLSLVGPTRSPVAVSPGQSLVDPNTGKTIFTAPLSRAEAQKKLVTVAPGTTLYDPETNKAVFTAPEKTDASKPTYMTDKATNQVYALVGDTATPVNLVGAGSDQMNETTDTSKVYGPPAPGTGKAAGNISAVPTPKVEPLRITSKEDAAAYTGRSPVQMVDDIMKGVSEAKDIENMPKDLKEQANAELAKRRAEATKAGDTLGVLRASAGYSKDVDQTFLTNYTKKLNILSQLDDIQASFKNMGSKVGPIIGILSSNNPYDAKAREFNAKLTAVVPNLARGVYGEVGVLTNQDIETYKKTIPNLRDTATANKLLMAMTVKLVQRTIEKELRTQANAGRDVSRFVSDLESARQQSNEILVSVDPNRFRISSGYLYELGADKKMHKIKE